MQSLAYLDSGFQLKAIVLLQHECDMKQCWDFCFLVTNQRPANLSYTLLHCCGQAIFHLLLDLQCLLPQLQEKC